MTFRAWVVEQERQDGRIVRHDANLRDLDDDFFTDDDTGVTVAVEYSSLNYKDGLALTGKPGIVRRSPLIPGIDLVGVVEESADERFSSGDRVVLNGDGLGEDRHGGLAQRARVRGDALVRLPDSLTSARAAAIGTAGFTAMLSVIALERHGVPADKGEVLVTGAAGGVGSIAVAVLAACGYEVAASTGRVEEQSDYLRRLGAARILDRAELSEPGKPLQSQRWAGVVDCVGSTTLANALAQTSYGGTVTACGLAQGADLPATVMPFILRAVTLAGVNSVEAPLPLRELAWERLAHDLNPDLLDAMTTEIALGGVPEAAARILDGKVAGRTLVDVHR